MAAGAWVFVKSIKRETSLWKKSHKRKNSPRSPQMSLGIYNIKLSAPGELYGEITPLFWTTDLCQPGISEPDQRLHWQADV